MGSSAKRKNEKRKDFQKPKLKVGKARPKPSNFTSTSFKSKNILVKAQSLTAAPHSSSSQFFHYLSNLSSRSESLRKESLSYLSSVLAARKSSSSSKELNGLLLLKALPLILDGSEGVRNQLQITLKHLHAEDVQNHAERILLFLRAGMTHISASIRNTAMNVLAWALPLAGDEFVSCSGGWMKTLKYFATMLGWPVDNNHEPSAGQALIHSTADDSKLTAKILGNLNTYLDIGLREQRISEEMQQHLQPFPLSQTLHHTVSPNTNTYAYLNLFRPPKHEDDGIYSTRIDRQVTFSRQLQQAIENGLATTTRHGGDVGRLSAKTQGTIARCMTGFTPT